MVFLPSGLLGKAPKKIWSANPLSPAGHSPCRRLQNLGTLAWCLAIHSTGKSRRRGFPSLNAPARAGFRQDDHRTRKLFYAGQGI